jgi:hypothetical protein
MPIYESEDEWRVVAVMNLVRIRRSVYEIGFGIAVGLLDFPCLAGGLARQLLHQHLWA